MSCLFLGLTFVPLRYRLYDILYFQAVVNPMQAFLNSLVYRGFGSCTLGGQEAFETENARKRLVRKPREGVQFQSATDIEDSENAPLLSFRTVSI